MTKWEYCTMDKDGYRIIFYKPNGAVKTEIKQDKAKGDASKESTWERTIAELGLDGWELVSTPWRGTAGTILYFKRPIS